MLWNAKQILRSNRKGIVSIRNVVQQIAYLIIDLPECRCHFVRQGASHNHDVALSWAGPEDDAESVQIIARCSSMHHLHSTASCTRTGIYNPAPTLSRFSIIRRAHAKSVHAKAPMIPCKEENLQR